MKKTNLARYNNSWYNSGSKILIVVWYITNLIFFVTHLNPSSGLKSLILKLFGAKIGSGVVIKPGVSVKYPWNLKIGDNSWIGENVWIDNLEQVIIGSDVCISQGSMLLTGNHNYKKPTFDLIVKRIIIEDGVWTGAKSTVCPGVTCKSHSILTVGSVASTNLDAFVIYKGNPCKPIRKRIFD